MGMWENGFSQRREGAEKTCSCEGRSLDARSVSELARLGLDPCLRRGTNCQILKIDALFANVEGAHSSPAETPVDSFV